MKANVDRKQDKTERRRRHAAAERRSAARANAGLAIFNPELGPRVVCPLMTQSGHGGALRYVRYWHKTDIEEVSLHVRFWG
jgi:hypothetical protein